MPGCEPIQGRRGHFQAGQRTCSSSNGPYDCTNRSMDRWNVFRSRNTPMLPTSGQLGTRMTKPPLTARRDSKRLRQTYTVRLKVEKKKTRKEMKPYRGASCLRGKGRYVGGDDALDNQTVHVPWRSSRWMTRWTPTG